MVTDNTKKEYICRNQKWCWLIVTLGITLGYIFAIEIYDHLINVGSETRSESRVLCGEEGYSVYEFHIPVPDVLDHFRVEVEAYGVDVNETVNVYFESYDEQYRLHLGTLTQGDDGKSTRTVLRAPETSLRGIYKSLDNLPPGDIGKFRIVFKKKTPGQVEIKKVKVRWSWERI